MDAHASHQREDVIAEIRGDVKIMEPAAAVPSAIRQWQMRTFGCAWVVKTSSTVYSQG